jgi:hypothetical protein
VQRDVADPEEALEDALGERHVAHAEELQVLDPSGDDPALDLEALREEPVPHPLGCHPHVEGGEDEGPEAGRGDEREGGLERAVGSP